MKKLLIAISVFCCFALLLTSCGLFDSQKPVDEQPAQNETPADNQPNENQNENSDDEQNSSGGLNIGDQGEETVIDYNDLFGDDDDNTGDSEDPADDDENTSHGDDDQLEVDPVEPEHTHDFSVQQPSAQYYTGEGNFYYFSCACGAAGTETFESMGVSADPDPQGQWGPLQPGGRTSN